MIGIWLWIGIVWAFAVVGILAFFHGAAELPRYGEECGEGCGEGCQLERALGLIWHAPGCPNLEQEQESAIAPPEGAAHVIYDEVEEER